MATRIWQDKAGNIALLFAILIPIVLGLIGGAIDYGRFALYENETQELADQAALAGAREFLLNAGGASVAEARARSVARTSLDEMAGVAAETLDISADDVELTVTVRITGAFEPSFLVGMFRRPLRVNAKSVAQVSGAANICVIGLNEADAETVYLRESASLRGPDCAVFANSKDTKALTSRDGAFLETEMSCTAGGYEGGIGNFDPTPVTDCPIRDDPLAALPEPGGGPCDFINHDVSDYVGDLSPGVYCGGLKITGSSVVNLNAGVFEIRDGPFIVNNDAAISGADVGVFFTGDDAVLKFNDKSEINLSAPRAGPMAGILFWRAADATGGNVYEIRSNFVDRLVGTIYLPNADLFIEATDTIAEASEYTVIVADHILLRKNTKLVLNAGYALSPVPVPAGVGDNARQVFLRE